MSESTKSIARAEKKPLSRRFAERGLTTVEYAIGLLGAAGRGAARPGHVPDRVPLGQPQVEADEAGADGGRAEQEGGEGPRREREVRLRDRHEVAVLCAVAQEITADLFRTKFHHPSSRSAALRSAEPTHRTVHADQVFDFHRPLREGDDVVARLTIERVRNRGNLDMVTILVALTVDGEAVCDARSTLMHTREEAPHD